MRKQILISTFLVLVVIKGFGQTDSIIKKHKHELGADITGLFKQFFNLNANSYYSPIYFVSYRYHLKKSNIRFGVGGEYTKKFLGPFTVNGEEKAFYLTQSNFSFRIGYERISELSKKWQVFYGIDFRPTIAKYDNPSNYSNAGYINGSTSTSNNFGFAPLLGFRYRISTRLSIITEASFSFNIEKTSSQKTYISQDPVNYPSIPNGKKITATNISATFSSPIFLILVADF